MTIFYILLNICFPYHDVIIPVYTKTNGCISTFCSTITTSSPTNLVCGFVSRCCILDISSSSARKTSTFSCSWIPFGYFSSWPPPLRSCGIFGIVVTYEIRVFFEGAQKEVFSSILKLENVNTWNTWIRWAKRWASWA